MDTEPQGRQTDSRAPDETTESSASGLVETATRWGARLKQTETLSAILLSIAVVATAYCAYEATRWGGVQSIALATASSKRIESQKAVNRANAELAYDASTFSQLAVLYSQNNVEGFELLRERAVREEFEPYLDEWIALEPLQNPDAPRTPFDLPNFENEDLTLSEELTQEAEASFKEATDANQTGDDYVLATVFFAGVLFFAGIVGKFESLGVRYALLVFGAAWLILGLVRAFTLPFY